MISKGSHDPAQRDLHWLLSLPARQLSGISALSVLRDHPAMRMRLSLGRVSDTSPGPEGLTTLARIRTFKPDMATSASLAAIPRELLYTWQQLWPQCDDAGRFYGDPRLVWAAIYPLRDDVTVISLAAELHDLASRNRVCCYRGCDGKVWLHVLGWEHQKIDRASDSRIPPCREHEPTALCVVHDTAPCASTPAMFLDAEPVSTDTLDSSRVTREPSMPGDTDAIRTEPEHSRGARETTTPEPLTQGPTVEEPPGAGGNVLVLASDSRALDAVPRTLDHGPRTKDMTAPTRRRGTRIPDDFTVTTDMRDWAHTRGWDDPQLDEVTEEFIDYWRSAASRNTKLDWTLTWKNRVRDQERNRRHLRVVTTGQSRNADILTRAAERARAVEGGTP